MKRVLSIMLALLLAVSLTACGKSGGAQPDPGSANTETTAGTDTQPSDAPSDAPSVAPSDAPSDGPSDEPAQENPMNAAAADYFAKYGVPLPPAPYTAQTEGHLNFDDPVTADWLEDYIGNLSVYGYGVESDETNDYGEFVVYDVTMKNGYKSIVVIHLEVGSTATGFLDFSPHSTDPGAGGEEEEPASLWTLPLPEPSFRFVTSGSDYADFTCTYDEANAYIRQLIAGGIKYYYLSDTDDCLYFGGSDGTGLQIGFNFYKNGDQSYMIIHHLEKASGFGTGWATNDFEMLFPEPPFDGWVKEQTGPNTYEMEVQGGLDTTGADRAKLLDYFRILCSYGFHIEVTGSVEGADGQPWDYEWKVTDGHGNTIEFMMDSGWCWITVTTGGSVSAEPAPSVSSWTTNPAARTLPEPPATYAVAEGQSSDTFCLIEITYATFNEIVSYAASLRDCGFSVDVQESSEETADGRLLYNYKAKNADGCSVSLSFSTMEGDYTVTYVEVYSN